MKKPNLFLALFTLFSVIAGVVVFAILAGGFKFETIFISVIALLFLAYAIPQFLSTEKDGVYNDEYTKKTLKAAASRSFYISVVMWFGLMWFGDLFENSAFHVAFGVGLMVLIFIVNALIIKYTGLKE